MTLGIKLRLGCRERPKIVSSPAPFQARGAGLGTRLQAKDCHRFNDYSSTSERLGQCSLKRRLTFEEEPGFEDKAIKG